jgi:hypothetical protein
MNRRGVGRLSRAAALVLLGACGTAIGNPGNAPLSSARPHQVYARALADAAIYEERHVLPLHPAVADGTGHVHVVTLTGATLATGRQTLAEETWVTVAPEVRDSCNSWSEREDLPMRLRQLLGLRPDDSVAYFIEMRAPAGAMFRPTVDPSIHTRTPCAPEQALLPGCGTRFPAAVDSAHVAWMAGQMLFAWVQPDGYPRPGAGPGRLGYPWTRLGYTYNWHPGSPRYGASEYLVRGGAEVEVTAVTPIHSYCGRVA